MVVVMTAVVMSTSNVRKDKYLDKVVNYIELPIPWGAKVYGYSKL